MFLAAGPTAIGFCEWVDRLGEAARVLEEPGAIGEGVQLLHLEAFMEGAARVGAAGRAVLVAARLPATTTRGFAQQ